MRRISRRPGVVPCLAGTLAIALVAAGAAAAIDTPILFVTQVPIPADFTTIGSTFGNHRATMQSVGRGGDLWIRYPDGTLKNLTAAAGYGVDGFQGDDAIAVRDPAVHWSGQKALFSMVIGAPEVQYEYEDYYWQIYEITDLGQGETPVIRLVPGQPVDFNNITPIYGSDDTILFTSDRPRNGARHLYPQLDEYELAPTVTGLWKLDPATGDLHLLNHAPSGDFTPRIDSGGRVIFTQWDHLQRDQLADIDAGPVSDCYDGRFFGTFDYADESAGAVILPERTEVFPEPRPCRDDLLAGTGLYGVLFNHFFPWQMNQDGTELETLNHIGRQELHGYLASARIDDPNVIEYYGQYPRFNENDLENMFQVREDPNARGIYIGTQAPEFTTHASGQLVAIDGKPAVNADAMRVRYLTHPDTASPTDTPSEDHSGLYRDPLRLTSGELVASHTAETREDENEGTRTNPESRYDLALKELAVAPNGYFEATTSLTGGVSKTISYWDPDFLVSYDGPLWELQATEVVARPRPPMKPLDPRGRVPAARAERMVESAGIDPAELRQYLLDNDLAIIASRNVTARDDQDPQQPFNLRVPGGVETIGAPGTVYDVVHMQLYQADQLRGLGLDQGGGGTPREGRRVLARALHDPAAVAANIPNPDGPEGSVAIATDGSVAAFVPASRALSWQLTDGAGTGVVRERYWLTFQPGEVRICTSCHGVNELDQAGNIEPTNTPMALLELLQHWAGSQIGEDSAGTGRK